MATFVLRLIAPRPNFAQTITDAEREIMDSHAAHWHPYLERGEMVVFGPVLTDEDSYGLAVVETDDEQALREFAAQDPVVTSETAAFEFGRLAGVTFAGADRGCTVSPARVAGKARRCPSGAESEPTIRTAGGDQPVTSGGLASPGMRRTSLARRPGTSAGHNRR